MDVLSLTEKQAYLAMYVFLVEQYQRTKSDSFGALLGSMSYLSDGGTADPAIWADWLRCAQKVLDEGADASLKLV